MKLDLKQIRELLDAFEERNMHKLEIKQGEFEITLERSKGQTEVMTAPTYLPPHHAVPHALPEASANKSIAPQASAPAEEDTARYITSPMVGTFYSAPAPDEAPFVKVGDAVKEGQVVCIIEAMKVMNEVKATQSGVVKEICIDNGHPVEFGTKIIKLG